MSVKYAELDCRTLMVNEYDRIALKILSGLHQKWRLVAILVNGKPLSIAVNNTRKTHPKVFQYNPYKRLHAEISCINKAPIEKVRGSILYVWRIGADGKFKMAKPCAMCTEIINSVEIKKVIYSTQEGKFEVMKI